MRKRGLLTWLIGLCLVFFFTAATQAQVIKLTMAEQNSDMAWGADARGKAMDQTNRGGDQGEGEDRYLLFPNPGEGTRRLERGQKRRRRYGLVYARLLAGYDPPVGCHYPSGVADEIGGEGQRGLLEAL